MSEQTDTEYQADQYTPYDNGEYHHAAPLHAEPAATYGLTPPSSPPKREPRRAWPLSARLAVAVLIIGLATALTMSLILLHTLSGRATQASEMASAEAGTLARLSGQLATVQAKVDSPIVAPKPYRPPAVLQHYGLCVSFGRNTANGDLVDVSMTRPTVSDGSYSCNQGTLVSVVPAP